MEITAVESKAVKDRIIATAIKLWQKVHDIKKVSLADIAREAGVSENEIYDNFGSWAGLVREGIRRLASKILEEQRAFLHSDLPLPEKLQGMLSVKMKLISGLQADLFDRICADPSTRQFVEEIYDREARPMLEVIIGEGKHQGYISPELPSEVIMVYLNIIAAGSMTCSDEIRRVVGDRELTAALAQIVYFGLFRKEFPLHFNGASIDKSHAGSGTSA